MLYLWLIIAILISLYLLRNRLSRLKKLIPFVRAIFLVSRLGLTGFFNIIGWALMLLPYINRLIRQSALQKKHHMYNGHKARKEDIIDVTPKEPSE